MYKPFESFVRTHYIDSNGNVCSLKGANNKEAKNQRKMIRLMDLRQTKGRVERKLVDLYKQSKDLKASEANQTSYLSKAQPVLKAIAKIRGELSKIKKEIYRLK